MRMTATELNGRLRDEWEHGFLHDIRTGVCDPSAADRLLTLLGDVAVFLGTGTPAHIDEPMSLDRRIVGRVWLIPFFIQAHIHVAEDLGIDTRQHREVMWRATDILAGVFGSGSHLSDEDLAEATTAADAD
jgi:hypothetical protein